MNRVPVSAQDMHALLEQEVRNLRTSEEWVRWLDAAATLSRYSFRNVVLITLQMPEATHVAGYHAWKKLGRQIMKNERGIKVLAPILGRPKSQPPASGTAQKQEEAATAAAPLIKARGPVTGYRIVTVWDVTQTVGPPISELGPNVPAVGALPRGLWDALAHEVSARGFTLSRRTDASSDGYTDYEDREIVVADHLDDHTAVSRLAHEVAHMRMHSGNQEIESSMCRGVREVEAESVAYILLAHHGLRTDGSAFPYVANWAATVDREEPEKVVEVTGARVVTFARELIASTSRHLKLDESVDRAAKLELPANVPVLPLAPHFNAPDL